MAGAIYKQLEKEYAIFTGSIYSISCNSGTSALHLGLLALDVRKGDEIIVPDFTMAACGFAVEYTGAKPVFIDCDNTLNIDVSKIEKAITKKTKAIMAVHVYGRLCNMKEILRIARKYKLKVIEDACEAQGAIYKSKADVTCYSFYRNKIIHAEEGGICTTNSKKIADKIEYLKCMAFDKDHSYFHKDIGYNYRMPDSQARLALKSLKMYPRNAEKRRKVEQWYNKALGLSTYRDAVWVYDVPFVWKKRYSRIPGLRQFFKPLSSMPMWKQKVGKNALRLSKRFYLPVYPDMKKKDVIALTRKL